MPIYWCGNIFWYVAWMRAHCRLLHRTPSSHTPFFNTTTCLFLRLCPWNCWWKSSSFPRPEILSLHTFRLVSNGSADCFPIHIKVYIDCLMFLILDLVHRKATSVKDKCWKDLNRKFEYAPCWADDQKMFVRKRCLAELFHRGQVVETDIFNRDGSNFRSKSKLCRKGSNEALRVATFPTP